MTFLKKNVPMYWPVIAIPAIMAALYWISIYSYLLFHSLVEVFSILICYAVFLITWNVRGFLKNDYFLFIGVAYLFVGGIDLLHTLAYKGMGVFPTHGANLATQLWISARYFESFSLLIAPVFMYRRIGAGILFAACSGLLFALLTSIFYFEVFPDSYLEGLGQTRFKLVSEYVICLILTFALITNIAQRQNFDARVLKLIIASIVTTIISELSFTLYYDVYGMFNFIGHTLKVVSFYLMYRAIIETGLRKPYSLLFRELQHEKIALRDAMSEYRNLVENLNEVIFKTDRLGTIEYISPQVENMLGYSPAELIGLKFSSILSEDCSDEFTHLLNETTFKSRNETVLRVRTRSGSFKWIQSNTRCIPGNNEVIGVQGIITDITKRKQEDAINSARLHLMEFAVDHSLDELLEETINEAEKVTDSSIGFYHCIDDDQKTISLQNWSTQTKARFCKAQGKGLHYDIDQAGVWVECARRFEPVIHNDYKSLADRKSLPENHAEVNRELVVPVLRGGKVKAMLGVGNKSTEYTKDDAESVALIADVGWEISERKRTELALKEHEQTLSLFIRHAPTALAMFDTEMRYLSVSNRWLTDYHLGGKKIIGRSHYEIFPEITDTWKAIHKRALEGETIKAEEDRFERQDGTVQWLRWEARPWYTAQDDIGGIVIFSEDISARKKAEEALRQSEQRLQLALNAANAGTWEWNPKDNTSFWSERLWNLYGLEKKDCNASLEAWLQTIYPEDRVSAEKSVLDAAFKGAELDAEWRTKDHNGSQRWLMARGRPILGADGKASSYIGIVMDITDRKMAEEAVKLARDNLEIRVQERTADLVRMNAELMAEIHKRERAEADLKQTLSDLSRSNKDLQHYAYVASHDLQEPLRSVAAALQLFAKKNLGKFDKDSDKLIGYAVEGSKRMKALIEDLLSYSRLTARTDSFTDVDTQQIVEQAIRNVQSIIDEKEAKVTLDGLPRVRGDSIQLLQIFQNLIHNAVKFGPSETSMVHISAERNGEEWIFSVKDNGIGIEKEYFDRIFVIFQQLNKKGPFHGTGIGLAIVKKVVERHRGRVWVESEPNKGSTFYFTVPD